MSFDWDTGYTCVWLCAASYCDSGTYYTLPTFKGYASGFVLTNRIGSTGSIADGFVGYIPSKATIYVVFQGSKNPMQFLADTKIRKVTYQACQAEYASTGKNPCQVHEGFYNAQKQVNTNVVNAVSNLRAQFPSFQVVVTGHSLGGALATIQAVSLIQTLNIQVRLFTFGAPREFNNQASSSVSSYITDKNRVTHFADPIVRLPVLNNHVFVYRHIHGEWYEQNTADGTNIFKSCGNCAPQYVCYFEDPTCSGQWDKNGVINVQHHSYYLGYPISTCNLPFMSPTLFKAAVVAPFEDVYNMTFNMTEPDVWMENATYAFNAASYRTQPLMLVWLYIALFLFFTASR